MKIEVIIEQSDGELWARVEGKSNFLPVTVGNTTEEVLANIRDLIADYLEHDEKKDSFWKKAVGKDLVFEIFYDVQAFFSVHKGVNAAVIAQRAGINPGLLRQYSSGVKHPGKEQVKKIQDAIHQLAEELSSVSLCA